MAQVDIGRTRLQAQESGSGAPLILVHGSWDDLRTWALVDGHFARDFRVFSYDRRGHGGSEDGTEPGTRRDDEDDLAGLIEALDLGPAHVAGNSFGASIVLGLAARRPELFSALCAHEPPLMALAADDPVVAEVAKGIGSVIELIESGQPEAGARAFAENIALGPGAWEMMPEEDRAIMVGLADTFVGEQRDQAWADIDLDALGGISCPVLFTQGSESPPFFSKIVARLAERIEGAEVSTLSGTGHIPHMTHPAEYVSAVSGFLTR